MTNKTNKMRSGLKFSLLLYIFSGLVLILGIAALVLSLSASRSILNNDIFFQLAGFGEIAQLILRPVQAALINVGIVIFLFFLVLAGLLFAVGRLLDRQTSLLKRLEEVENRIESLTPVN